MLRIIGVLLLIPILDVLLLVVLMGVIGWEVVVLAVVLSALVGLLLARAEGRNTLRKIQQKLTKGEPPTDELLDAALLLVAGGFLLTPGLVTDAVGLLLVVPLTRYPVRLAVKRWVVVPLRRRQGRRVRNRERLRRRVSRRRGRPARAQPGAGVRPRRRDRRGHP